MKVIFPNFIKEDNKNVWKLPMQSANFQIISLFVIQSKISGERYATGGSNLRLRFKAKSRQNIGDKYATSIINLIIRVVPNQSHTNKFSKEKQKELFLFYSNHCRMGKDYWRKSKRRSRKENGLRLLKG